MGDTPEKRVLRRKRQVMCVDFLVTDKLLAVMTKQGIMNTSAKQLVQAEGTNAAKVTKLLDVMNGDSASFNKFCLFIEEDYEGLAEELRAELKADKGELRIEPYIQRESAILVQKEFGHSKRLSQAEKKDMEDIIALKTQCTKEVWRKRLAASLNIYETEKRKNVDRNKRLNLLIQSLSEFLQSNQNKFPRDDAEGSDAQGENPSSDEDEAGLNPEAQEGRKLVKELDTKVQDMLELTTHALQYRDRLREERARALRVLNCSDPNSPLDALLREALERARRELETAQREARMKEEEARRLEQQVDALRLAVESEVASKDEKVHHLNDHLEKSKEKVHELHDDIGRMRAELRGHQAELNKYKTRAELLEKHRRLGYRAGQDKIPLNDVKSPAPKLPTLVMSPKGVQVATLPVKPAIKNKTSQHAR